MEFAVDLSLGGFDIPLLDYTYSIALFFRLGVLYFSALRYEHGAPGLFRVKF
jgi:hypothetical protein